MIFLNFFIINIYSLVPQKEKNERSKKRNQRKEKSQPSQKIQHQSTQSVQVNSSSYNDIYTDVKNPASYSSNVRAFVNQKRSISLHKKRIKKFSRRPYIVPGPFHTIAADLIDYQKIKGSNSNFRYILTVIDCFSRFCYARPLKRKTAQEVSEALESIISSMQYIPKFFTSDQGLEFDVRNEYIRNVLIEKYHLVVYFTKGATKNAMVERLNRTLKERLQRYFSESKTKRWLDVLSDFISNINHSINRTIGMRPVDVTLDNAEKIWSKLYPNANKRPKCDKILVGDRVRIPIEKSLFAKGYEKNWSEELYTVERIERSMGFCLYILKTTDNVILPRKFYISELNFVSRLL